jgi:Bacterial surface proteins containing Ig-like domains
MIFLKKLEKSALILILIVTFIFMMFSSTSFGFATTNVTGISLDKYQLALKAGQTYTLKTDISPSNATNKSLTFTSANKSIASVDKNGKIKAVKNGNTYITVASSSNKNIVKRCYVSVASKVAPTTVSLELTSLAATVKEDQSSNVLVKQIESKLNVKLRFIPSTPDNMRLHLATGQAGDIFAWQMWATNTSSLIMDGVEEGLFNNLSDIAKKNPGRYPTLEKAFSDKYFQFYNSQYYKQPKEDYAFWAAGYTTFPKGQIVYNTKIMKELGAKYPTTVDEFVSYLRAVKKAKPDIIPFFFRNDKGLMLANGSCELDSIFFQTRGLTMNKMVKDSKGVWSDSAIDPRNKAIWKELAGLYKDGLIDKEIFTTETDSYFADKFATGKMATCTMFMPNQNPTGILTNYETVGKANPTLKPEDYRSFMDVSPEPLKGPGGYQKNNETSLSIHYGSFIPTTCKNPEKAMDVLNYLFSDEGMTLMWYGVKGVHYTSQDADGTIQGFNAAKMEADNKNWKLWSTVTFWVCLASGSGQIYYTDRYGWLGGLQKQSGMITSTLPKPLVNFAVTNWNNWSSKVFTSLPPYYSALKSIDSTKTITDKLREIRLKYFVGYIFGSLDVDSTWDTYVKECKDAGLDQFVKTYSDLEKSSKAKFDNITK